MTKKVLTLLLVAGAITGWLPAVGSAADEALPTKAASNCLKCHAYDKEPGVFAGRVAGVSNKAKTLQLEIDKQMETVYFDDGTSVKNADTMKGVKENASVKVVYFTKNGKNFAKEVVVKKGLDVPKEKLATVEEVAALLAKRPEKAKYVLLDSRPPERFNEGYIPTSKVMPLPAFDKLAETLLPKEKDVLQIYYCEGFT